MWSINQGQGDLSPYIFLFIGYTFKFFYLIVRWLTKRFEFIICTANCMEIQPVDSMYSAIVQVEGKIYPESGAGGHVKGVTKILMDSFSGKLNIHGKCNGLVAMLADHVEGCLHT